jgi:very-short-patch-repair endonuclease
MSAVGTGHARALRRRMTDAEKLIWRRIRDRQLAGAKFKRQHPLCGYIVDFGALDLKLVIEIDGGQHVVQAEKDAERTRILEESGYHVVRFWNHDVLGNIEGVLSAILQELAISR